MKTSSNGQYEAFSPWADVDPVLLRGISPRVTELAGKRVGLFCNFKPGASPILSVVEAKLKEKFPSIEVSQFIFSHNMGIDESAEKDSFEQWLKGVDTVINAVGD